MEGIYLYAKSGQFNKAANQPLAALMFKRQIQTATTKNTDKDTKDRDEKEFLQTKSIMLKNQVEG